jgi:hypothetical protein
VFNLHFLKSVVSINQYLDYARVPLHASLVAAHVPSFLIPFGEVQVAVSYLQVLASSLKYSSVGHAAAQVPSIFNLVVSPVHAATNLILHCLVPSPSMYQYGDGGLAGVSKPSQPSLFVAHVPFLVTPAAASSHVSASSLHKCQSSAVSAFLSL